MSRTTRSSVTTRVLDGFDDAKFGQREWQELLRASNIDHIYLTWHFQRAWWETFGTGQLLLILAERDAEPVALAPLYADSGMVYFVGSAFESDYLDFIGDISDPTVLEALLVTAREATREFLGFTFYFVADRHGTHERLGAAAEQLGLLCWEEHDMHAALLDLAAHPEAALEAANKKRLLKLERSYQREAPLEVHHLHRGDEILSYLDEFFEQHISRWAGAPRPSRFVDQEPRHLIERFTENAADSGWLRFTRLAWQDRNIAFHYGYSFSGRYYWGMPSFAPDLARRSPGQLMTRHLLLAAIEEGARLFDFGTGTQPFKLRHATQVDRVRTWSLCPSDAASEA